MTHAAPPSEQTPRTTPPHDAASQRPVAVLGAGISGLTAAYALHQQGCPVLLIEKQSRVGGPIFTETTPSPQGDYVLEWGPNSFPSSSKELLALIHALGLNTIQTGPDSKQRYISVRDVPVLAPSNPISFLASPLLSLWGKCRFLMEPFCPRYPWPSDAHEEPSMATFITHRLGKEALDVLVAPFLTGVYAGDCKALGAESVFPFLKAWEQEQGSLFKGAVAFFLKKAKEKKQLAKAAKAAGQPMPPKSAYALLNIEGGLGQLTQALAAALPTDSLLLNTEVQTLQAKPDGGYWLQLSSGQQVEVQGVLSALPAFEAARLLDTLGSEGEAASLLAGVQYAPLWVTYQAFERAECKQTLKGFGILKAPLPPDATPWLGSLWTSSLFPQRCPASQQLLSHFMGGSLHPEVRLWDADKVLALATQRSQWLLGSKASPVFEKAMYWHKATPQYTQGHLARMQCLRERLATSQPRLVLAGNFLTGINLNQCVVQAQHSATALLEALRTAASVAV